MDVEVDAEEVVEEVEVEVEVDVDAVVSVAGAGAAEVVDVCGGGLGRADGVLEG